MNRNLLFVASALMLWGFGEGVFFNFVPIRLANEFMLNKEQVGLALGAFGFFMAVTFIPGGHIADRFGRRPLIVTAWILGVIAALTMAIAKNLPLYLIGLFIYGLTAFVSSPLSSYVTAARGKWEVGTALSLTTATYGLGMALGPVVGGAVAERYGLGAAYWIAFGVFMISTLFVVFVERQPLDVHDPDAPPVSAFQNTRFVNLLMIYAFAVFAMYIAQPLTPNFLNGVRNLSFTQTGWIFSAGALGNSLLALIIGRLEPRRGFIIAQLLVIFFALLIWQGAGLPIFMLGYFLLGGFRAARPMAMAQARSFVHESQMGLSYGAMETVSAIIFIIAPPIAGFIFERNPFIVYPLAIGLILVSMVISYLFSPQKVKAEVSLPL